MLSQNFDGICITYIENYSSHFRENGKTNFRCNPIRDPPADYNELYALAMKGSDALTATHGKVYEVNIKEFLKKTIPWFQEKIVFRNNNQEMRPGGGGGGFGHPRTAYGKD